ncbi:PREDICTED: uncharacterized protein LOC108362250 [Rhagoletis zephyria]|uniref:uncharacterized protein LOC108362250 n=1 Tax=Rhagoletis zephyria TaxID=28612 RepID=UPI0008117EBD|nr:PREDICTED: uncharacterized protein LOC108362250 [Rhagoletis zephyria]
MTKTKENQLTGVLTDLPTLKRKRQSEGYLGSVADISTGTKTCFTNSAFSSTPKKIVARRRTANALRNNCMQDPCLEVKSIADILKPEVENKVNSEAATGTQTQNPYEVVRKPPKKKKRESEIIESCFENRALNLELPEKQFNPYEVLRELPGKPANVIQSNCFVNAALNLRSQDASSTRNPFEIQRCTNVQPITAVVGVENRGLDDGPAVPTDLKIVLPFKPTLGCRIDFSNIPIEQLTPTKLLADKLVFSPVLAVPKRSLDSASEESSMDIGKELDRYQLELENSINEAKMRKTNGTCMDSQTSELTLQVDVEQKITFTQRLAEIVEEDEEKENESFKDEIIKTTTTEEFTIQSHDTEISGKAQIEHVNDELKTEDVAYASDSDDEEIDFRVPAPFVRAYHRINPQHATGSKESLHSTGSSNSATDHKKSLNVRNIIRKSLRKLMHPNKHDDIAEKKSVEKQQHLLQNEEVETKEKQPHIGAYKFIRNSLRRKAVPKTTICTEKAAAVKAEISIIDTSERSMKLKAELLPKAEGDRKHSLRSSLRRSTREIGQHFMKTVFHKNQEAYEFTK